MASLKGIKLKLGYVFFLAVIVVAILSMLNAKVNAHHGSPNSDLISYSYSANYIGCAIAILSVSWGLYLLIKENAGLVTSIFFWCLMTICVTINAIVIIRCTIWLSISDMNQYFDIKNHTYYRESKGLPPTTNMIYIHRKYKCCGIEGYYDWENILKEVEFIRKTPERFQTKIPDICCKIPTRGCGTWEIYKIFDRLIHSISLCEDLDEAARQKCNDESVNYGKASKKEKEDYKVITVTDSRIDPITNKNSLKEWPEVDALCKSSAKKEAFRVLVYYSGFMRKAQASFQNATGNLSGAGDLKDVFKPCSPQEVKDEEAEIIKKCETRTVPKSYFDTPEALCSWVEGKVAADNFTLSERVSLVKNNPNVFGKPCKPHLLKYINDLVYTLFVFNIVLTALEIACMVFFHNYYFIFRLQYLKTLPTPRWYEPLQNEDPQIIGFGDLEFKPDGSCTQLPPIVVRKFVDKPIQAQPLPPAGQSPNNLEKKSSKDDPTTSGQLPNNLEKKSSKDDPTTSGQLPNNLEEKSSMYDDGTISDID